MKKLRLFPKKQLQKSVSLAIEKNAFTYLILIQKQEQKGKEIY